MGLKFYITRAIDWRDSESSPITRAEWLSLVQQDDHLTITGVHGECFAVWDGESEYGEPWLDWQAGYIFTEDADTPLIEKMLSIAEHFNARVQDAEGGFYRSPGAVISQGEKELSATPVSSKKSWLNRLLGN